MRRNHLLAGGWVYRQQHPVSAHEALRADIEELLRRRGFNVARSVANEAVHLVVLHGLLPEVELPAAGAPRFDAGPQEDEDADGVDRRLGHTQR